VRKVYEITLAFRWEQTDECTLCRLGRSYRRCRPLPGRVVDSCLPRRRFPLGTFFVNVTGSFLIGIVLVLVEGGTLPAEARLFLAVGILGGNTTFSSFSYETLQLLNGGDVVPVLFNTLGQLLIGLLAVYLGVVVARTLGGI
jgi:CrcB protein